jgi:hypothetical protein
MTAGSVASSTVPVCYEQCPHMLILCIAMNIVFLLTIFKEGAGNVIHWLADAASHLTNTLFIACQGFVR